MTTIKAAFGHAEYSDADLCESIGGILSRGELAALATARDGEPHVATVSYAFTPHLTLYFISAQTDVHSQDVALNPAAAVAIWTTPETWGKDLQGIQIFGRCEELKVGPEFLSAMRIYLARFPAYTALLKNPEEFKTGVHARMYAVRPGRLRLVDEPAFGRRTFIDADVVR
jgi:uncharacterized protein YhbP (UPF0306 family)